MKDGERSVDIDRQCVNRITSPARSSYALFFKLLGGYIIWNENSTFNYYLRLGAIGPLHDFIQFHSFWGL